jgi:polysaccharide export outer membrane protein
VRPDGKISLPLIGEFEAAGSTAKQLEAKLTQKLESIVTNPQVTVIVQDIRSQKYSIMGEVNRPGSFALTPQMTVLDAVAVAGGLRDFAKPKKMYILRRGPNNSSTKIPVNYKDILNGAAGQNITLQARDTIVVP